MSSSQLPIATWIGTQLHQLKGMSTLDANIMGVRLIAIVVGVIIIVTGILPAFTCRERYADIAKKEDSGEKMSFGQICRSLIQNKPLLMILGVTGTYLLTIIVTIAMAYYMYTYYIYGGDVVKGTMLSGIDGTLRFFFAMGAAYGIKKLSEKYDKHVLMIACVVILLIGFIGMYFTMIPGHPYLALSMRPFVSIGEVGFWILIVSMRADVCDWDEYLNGKRREGLISASCNWVNKRAISLALILGGLVLEHIVEFNNEYDPQNRIRNGRS